MTAKTGGEDLLKRITVDPGICYGKPIIRGLRYPVQYILELLASGMTHQEILDDYEDLEEEDFLACILFAAKILEGKSLFGTCYV